MGLGNSYTPHGTTKVSDTENREHQGDVLAKRTLPLPLYMDEVFDYASRDDGQPVYVGYGPPGLSQSTTGWIIFKFTYNASGFITAKNCTVGVWSSRATLF